MMKRPHLVTIPGGRGPKGLRPPMRLLVSYTAPGTSPYIDDFCAGARASGWRVVHREGRLWTAGCDLIDCDLVVVNGTRSTPGVVAAAYRAAGIPVCVYDLPPFRFVPGAWAGLFRDLAGNPFLPAAGLPDRLSAFPLPPRLSPSLKGPLVLVGQVATDSSHRITPAEYQAWLRDAAAALDASGQPWVYRPHPKQSQPLLELADYRACPMNETIPQMLLWARGVICWGSTVQYEALYHRVPVSIGVRGDALLPAPRSDAEADAILQAVGWNQFSPDELRSGLAIGILTDGPPIAPAAEPAAEEIPIADPDPAEDTAGPAAEAPRTSAPRRQRSQRRSA
jgi:hypothetical protein